MLEAIQKGEISVEEGMEKLRNLPFDDLQFARIDSHRELRRGQPEAIYCPGKKPEHLREIVRRSIENGSTVFGTRCAEKQYEAIKDLEVEYYPEAHIVFHGMKKEKRGLVAVITGGTSDYAVAEECAVSLELMGNNVMRLYDVGIAGIHRLLSHLEDIKNANAIVCIAGMEGALPGVVAGLVDVPVIAVPTSVGYGANFSGLTALLGMMSSCSPGIAVVNIDNGYGAAYMASMINRKAAGGRE